MNRTIQSFEFLAWAIGQMVLTFTEMGKPKRGIGWFFFKDFLIIAIVLWMEEEQESILFFPCKM